MVRCLPEQLGRAAAEVRDDEAHLAQLKLTHAVAELALERVGGEEEDALVQLERRCDEPAARGLRRRATDNAAMRTEIEGARSRIGACVAIEGLTLPVAATKPVQSVTGAPRARK